MTAYFFMHKALLTDCGNIIQRFRGLSIYRRITDGALFIGRAAPPGGQCLTVFQPQIGITGLAYRCNVISTGIENI